MWSIHKNTQQDPSFFIIVMDVITQTLCKIPNIWPTQYMPTCVLGQTDETRNEKALPQGRCWPNIKIVTEKL